MTVPGGRGAPNLLKHIAGKSTTKNKRRRTVTWSRSVLYRMGLWLLKISSRSRSVKRLTGVKPTSIYSRRLLCIYIYNCLLASCFCHKLILHYTFLSTCCVNKPHPRFEVTSQRSLCGSDIDDLRIKPLKTITGMFFTFSKMTRISC